MKRRSWYYLAGRYRAIEQGANAFGQPIECNHRDIRRAMNGQRERGGHAPLGGDELDVGSQPTARRIDGRGRYPRQSGDIIHIGRKNNRSLNS